MASTLWRVMQLIEANRHLAEQMETAASTAGPECAPALAHIALQRRKIADEIYDQYRCDGGVGVWEQMDPVQMVDQIVPMNARLARLEPGAANDVRPRRLRRKAA